MPTAIRAMGVREYGGPDVLTDVEVQPEPIGSGLVRIDVKRAAVNPVDVLIREGRLSAAPAPATVDVPGMDVAGLVLEVGDGVSGVTVGDRVMALVVPHGEHGGYRDEVVVSADSVNAVPAGFSLTQSATLPMNAMTARAALNAAGLAPGSTLAVTGAAGALGGCLVQLAKADGLRVVADASDADHDLLTSLGADVVVPRGDAWANTVREAVPDGVDALADAAVLGNHAAPVVRDGGVLVAFRGWDGDGDRRLSYRPVNVVDVAGRNDWVDAIRTTVEAGELTPRVADLLPAAKAGEAHRRLEIGGVRGRLVLDFD